MTIERVFPSGAIRISDLTDDGHLFTRLYFDYTEAEAIELFQYELLDTANTVL